MCLGRCTDNSFMMELTDRLSLSNNSKIIIYKTIILSVAVHGCEARSLILRDESRLRVFENRIRRDANWNWIRLHTEELYSFCSRIIKSVLLNVEFTGYIARMEVSFSFQSFNRQTY